MAKPYTADKRLYLNADRSAVVDERSPEATYLLAPAGAVVPADLVKQYGLGAGEQADAAPAADPAPTGVLTEAASFRAAGDPPANDPAPVAKAVAPAEDKAVAAPKRAKEKQ
jgi:hypothetical protein